MKGYKVDRKLLRNMLGEMTRPSFEMDEFPEDAAKAIVAGLANMGSRLSRYPGPRVALTLPAEDILAWVIWNDPNGDYDEIQKQIRSGRPDPEMLDALWEIFCNQVIG